MCVAISSVVDKSLYASPLIIVLSLSVLCGSREARPYDYQDIRGLSRGFLIINSKWVVGVICFIYMNNLPIAGHEKFRQP